MSQQDLYKILGVDRGADASEIKKAYRKLAHQHHPDRNPDDAAAEERFKQISAANQVLGDEKKRKIYDEFGIDGLREGFDPNAARSYQQWAGRSPGGFNFNFGEGLGGFGDLDDILGSLMGGRGRRRRPVKGRDQSTELTISVKQAVEGGHLHVPALGGRIKVAGGLYEGQKIRLAGKGQPGPAGPGDLLLTLRIATPGFEREGDDLSIEVPVTIRTAVVGGAIEIPTPEGTILRMKIPAGTQGGRRMRLRGKGLPKKGGERGHLFAQIVVRVPTGDSDELLELVERLEAFYDRPKEPEPELNTAREDAAQP